MGTRDSRARAAAARRRPSICLHPAVAGQPQAEERHDRRVHMKQRPRDVQPLPPFVDRREAAAGGVGSTGGKFIALRRPAAFRPAGRARGVTQAGGRLWRGRRAIARLRRGRQRRCKTPNPATFGWCPVSVTAVRSTSMRLAKTTARSIHGGSVRRARSRARQSGLTGPQHTPSAFIASSCSRCCGRRCSSRPMRGPLPSPAPPAACSHCCGARRRAAGRQGWRGRRS